MVYQFNSNLSKLLKSLGIAIMLLFAISCSPNANGEYLPTVEGERIPIKSIHNEYERDIVGNYYGIYEDEEKGYVFVYYNDIDGEFADFNIIPNDYGYVGKNSENGKMQYFSDLHITVQFETTKKYAILNVYWLQDGLLETDTYKLKRSKRQDYLSYVRDIYKNKIDN